VWGGIGAPGIGDMLGMGDIDGMGDMLGIGDIGALFIGIFGSSIIFFMSASIDLQQSACGEWPEPGCRKTR